MARLVRALGPVLVALALLAACGSGNPIVDAQSARAAVERAAGVKLGDDVITPALKAQGVTAFLTNSATMTADRQIVQVFVLANGDKVKGVRDQLGPASSRSGSRIVVHKNLVVVYAAFPKGDDRGNAIESAVNGL